MYVRVKVVVICHGETAPAWRLALAATEGAWDAHGEVRLRRLGRRVPAADTRELREWDELLRDATCIPEATPADLAWADVALLGTSAPDGRVVERLRRFVDAATPLWRDGGLAGKVFGAYTARDGAPERSGSRLATLGDVLRQWGGLVVPLAADASDLAAAAALGRRATETARALKSGRPDFAAVA